MEKLFVPYELALKLKELGFDEECLAFYDKHGKLYFNLVRDGSGNYGTFKNVENLSWVGASLFQQTFDWFREKYGLCHFINHSGGGYCSGWEDLGNNEHGFGNYNTYEEARLKCLEKLIELCTKK